ncbi:unnamed protein product [Effrenium voratum]|nr:unnamed protein product [Effrenium voratum]
MKLAPRNRPTSSCCPAVTQHAQRAKTRGERRSSCQPLPSEKPGVAKTDMAIREGEVNRWLAWCSDEQTGMLQQRPTRGASSMSKIAAPAGLCQSSVFSNWRSASMDTAVTS